MKIKLYRSSTIGILFENFKILQDPWLTDGEYFGSWSHYPHFDLDKNFDEINSYDAIYVSHIHLDHCSDKTLKKINKDIPIYIHSYHAKFLKNKLERFGFKVIELLNGKKYEISKNINLRIFASDNCNPELCYKFFGCANLSETKGSQQIDTVAVFDNSENVLINVNDAPYELTKSTFEDIKKFYKKIDILLCGYQVAGAYPQCFDNLNDKEKIQEGKRIGQIAMNKALGYINDLKPKFFLPFAGTYALSGKLSELDKLRGAPTIDDAYEYLSTKQNFSKPILINPDSIFDLNLEKSNKNYEKFNKKNYQRYVDGNLSSIKFDYENEKLPDLTEIINLSKTAYKRFLQKKNELGIKLNTDIYVEIYDTLIKIPKKDDENFETIKKSSINKNSQYIIYKTDPRLLKMLLMGPRYAHWNNAEIGSHIRFFRNPNVYERNIWGSMCYFHN
jgi:UDP-MurNAc hydroxylase